MNKVFVHHILPLEFYPPVTNLLRLIEKENLKVQAYSTYNNKGHEHFKLIKSRIFRSKYPAFAENFFGKLLSYFNLCFGPLFRLLVFKPDKILYFEPHSSFPIYLYKRFFNKKVEIYIHNHEYYPHKDFQNSGMSVISFFHKREVNYLYPRAIWISQTNEDRLDYFSKDYPFISDKVLYTLANYPPKDWITSSDRKRSKSAKIRFLYIGALSFENTFIQEIVEYIIGRSEQMHLTIYSNNLKEDVMDFLKKYKEQGIKLMSNGIPYDEIPKLASKFDVGLVLYKGHNLNYIYNAPNKLFEYLALGLDVWVPHELEGCKPYINNETRPTVTLVAYQRLRDELIADWKEFRNKPYHSSEYTCEQELTPLILALKS